MSTLLYSPAVQIRIKTARNGIVDVSDDIERGNVGLRQNQPHSMSVTLLNPRRKYDRIFTPNDRVIVRLKRLRWVQSFSGYLNQVPFFSAFPGSVSLTATCTAKRLQYTYWDPGFQDSVNFLNALTSQSMGQTDSGLAQKAVALLTEVVDWAGDKIHIGRLPDDWVEKIDALAKELGPSLAVPANLLGTTATVAGSTAVDSIGKLTLPGADGKPDVGKGYGEFKASTGTIGSFDPKKYKPNYRAPSISYYLDEKRYKGSPNMIGLDLALADLDVYGANDHDSSGQYDSKAYEKAKAWWAGKRVTILNPKTNKSVVGIIAIQWDGVNTIRMSPELSKTIGAKNGDRVFWRFSDPQTLAPGTVVAAGGTATGATDTAGLAAGATGGQTGSTTPSTVTLGDVKLSFEGADNLKGNVRAARDFVKQNWAVLSIGGYSYRNVAGTNKLSDHGKGLALDLMVSSGVAVGDQKALGNSLAMWFASNPGVFGVKQIIWFDRINDGSGWRPYRAKADADSANQRHANHVHVSFYDTGQTAAGAPGIAWKGATPAEFEGGFASGQPGTPTGGAGGAVLTNAYNWITEGNPESNTLVGPRRLMNDEPILPMFETLMSTSQRAWCTAPNGDLIAWFPDYFGHYGLAGKVAVQPIELIDLSMTWNDERLKTHFFTAGSYSGYGAPGVEAEVAMRKFQTTGIASVEFPEILETLLNVNREDPASAGWVDSNAILQRFGARPEFRSMGTLAIDGRAEFWYALHLFRENWASQFSAKAQTTWMPEMWPGVLMQLPLYGIQFYVEAVDHSFDFSEGGSFTTSTTITAPSALTGSGFYGLPRGGEQAGGNPIPVGPPTAGTVAQPNGINFSSQGSTVYSSGGTL